jgi:hypothetical protein
VAGIEERQANVRDGHRAVVGTQAMRSRSATSPRQRFERTIALSRAMSLLTKAASAR